MTSKFCLQTKEYETQWDIPSVKVKLVTARKNKILLNLVKGVICIFFIYCCKETQYKQKLTELAWTDYFRISLLFSPETTTF